MTKALALDELRSAVAGLPDDGLAATRRAALEHLESNGLPTLRNEDWKYTDLSAVIETSNNWLASGDAASDATVRDVDVASIVKGIDATWLVIANGRLDGDALEAARDCGFQISRLSDDPDELDFSAPLADLNTALLVDGLRIRVGDADESRRPIGLLFADRAEAAAGVSQVRIEIDVAERGHARIIEYYHSDGPGSHYSNAVLNIRLGAGAAADHVRVQARGTEHNLTSRTSVRLGRDSTFRHGAFDLGGALVRNDLAIDIAAPGATTEFAGVYLAGEGQHIDNHTRVDHREGPAQSSQEYRGIATGNGRCVWNGKAIVHVGADGTDAQQANHNLLLSERAEIDAKPELEIYADDVKCSHGTTIGQLDATALYYLRTRGIGRREAEGLLTHAFARSVVDQAPLADLRETLGTLVEARLAEILGETT